MANFNPLKPKNHHPKKPALMNLDSNYYHFLSDKELLLLSRLAVLTKNGQSQCNYTNEQGKLELNLATRSLERAFANLKEFKLIDLSRGYLISKKRGRLVRLVSLCSAPVVFTGKRS